ncbi:chromosome segregation protein SMC [Sulfuriroseicoccus oceanibius]|uniref:Chromosome partition protein Smc n=1 Tax=Sulfuriroseicoccus oceanibius TaxID=2707525 RepID=A0A6B3L3S7_9BACT|nr:chromosome segregation protein SMC [Sulfuriroseicoccus oceanibius]QQL43959.1 chromosome segregation protein SMC [Sulfuriroseicoccus oceanibius]
MYLKSLDIHGFKSFADKTRLEFHEGVTGIVGPNGCGKSNVVDAIRWVLGETSAKALRGGEMADVIFSGTEKRKPLGMAEVTLTMADCEESLGVDFNEVAITRRVFRDGRSEYRLNGTQCRLRDINELFMDTGIGRTAYSIMEQGKIDMLLSSKPEDRRAVFEEAAGITKFKKQKRETLRKLEYTEANLLRITDIIAEVKRQMNSLQRQAAKARRYRALLEDVRVLDTHLSFKQFTELSVQKHDLTRSIDSLQDEFAELETTLTSRELELEVLREQMVEVEARVSENRAQLNERHNRIDSARSRISYNLERCRELADHIARNEADVAATASKIDQQKEDLAQAEEAVLSIQSRIEEQRELVAEAERHVAEFRDQRGELASQLATHRAACNQAESRTVTLQAQIENIRSQAESDRARAEAMQTELRTLRESESERRGEAEQLDVRLAELTETATQQNAELAEAEQRQRTAQSDLTASRNQSQQLHRELTAADSRLNVLRKLAQNGEGLERGTQAVITGLDDPDFFKNGVRGVLGSFLQVGNEDVRAIEAVLGPRLQTILVADSTLAHRIVEVLREKKLGQAAILAEDVVQPAGENASPELPAGAVAWAHERIQANAKVLPVFAALLRDVLIVPDLDTAWKLRPNHPQLTFTTIEGELLTPEGIVHGGVDSDDGGSSVLARQNEIRELEAQTASLSKAHDEAVASEEELTAEIEQLNDQLAQLREAVQTTRVERSTLEGQRSLVSREVEQIANRIENLERDADAISQRDTQSLNDIEAMEEELAAARITMDDAMGLIDGLEQQLGDFSERENQAADELSERRTALAVEERSLQALEEQRTPMAARLAELNEITTRRNQESDGYRAKISEAEQQNRNLEQIIEDATAGIELLESELEADNEERQRQQNLVREHEATLQQARKRLSAISDQRGREEVKSTQVELRLENIINTCQERHGVDLAEFEQDLPALKASIDQSKKRLKRGGASQPEDDAFSTEADTETTEASSAPSFADTDIDWQFVETTVGEMRRRLESMGPVNLDAIHEFEEAEERYNFLDQQQNDLVRAKSELQDIIEHINQETRKRFSETFEIVRNNFQSMFKELFGERGQANLIMMDDEDPLESGIEVIAKPPGKKLQSITLLSGGERSMTAVALLFSIYMVKPSPFCVLDELDAPLDESNIGRFLKVLDRFIDQSQFIIVTHSKRTMGRADVMYGVTMEEFGVSKPVGMRLTHEEKKPIDETKDESELTAAEKAALRLDA